MCNYLFVLCDNAFQRFVNYHRLRIEEPQLKIKSANTILYCKKWQETVSFYRDGIKLPILLSNDWFVEFKLNEASRLSVANEARASVKSGSGQGVTISLQVADLEQTLTELHDAGIQSTPIKDVWGAMSVYVRDPEGNRLEFWEGRAKFEQSS